MLSQHFRTQSLFPHSLLAGCCWFIKIFRPVSRERCGTVSAFMLSPHTADLDYVLYTHLVSSERKISALQGHKSYSVVGTEKPHNFAVRAGAYLPVSVGCWAGFGLTVAAFIRRAIQEVSSVLGQLSFFIWCSLASISLSLGEGYHWLEQCFWHT